MGRYDRQLIEFTEEEQGRIRSANVGIVGCGGLGTYVSTALALAGIGKLTMMDPDSPDVSNLNRQFAYCEHVLSGEEPRPKADLLGEWVRRINPDVQVEAHAGRFGADSGHLFDGCDVMVDCLDSVSSRMALNEYAVAKGKPLVHGGISGFDGELCTVVPRETPCLRCILGDMPDSSSAPASIGSVVMTIGAMESTEVLKLVAGRKDESRGRFFSYDFSCGRTVQIDFQRDPDCPVCGRRRRLGLLDGGFYIAGTRPAYEAMSQESICKESFERMTLTVYEMRRTIRFEAEGEGDSVRISLYDMSGCPHEERVLMRQASMGRAAFADLLNECGLAGWDGFRGERPADVHDGTRFVMEASAGGRGIRAEGAENFPPGYRRLERALNDLLYGRPRDAVRRRCAGIREGSPSGDSLAQDDGRVPAVQGRDPVRRDLRRQAPAEDHQGLLDDPGGLPFRVPIRGWRRDDPVPRAVRRRASPEGCGRDVRGDCRQQAPCPQESKDLLASCSRRFSKQL